MKILVYFTLFRPRSDEEHSVFSFKLLWKCLANIVAVLILCWIFLEFSQRNIQNVSRVLCNLSFIFLIVNKDKRRVLNLSIE